MLSLEERISFLESRLEENRAQEFDHPPRISEPAGDGQPLNNFNSQILEKPIQSPTTVIDIDSVSPIQVTVDRILNLLQQDSGQEMAFSKILLGELLQARPIQRIPIATAAREDQTEASNFDIFSNLDDFPVSLPTRETAQNLIKAYFQFADFSMPLLHAPTFQRKVDVLYDKPRLTDLTGPHTTTETRLAVFFVFEVFAVALMIMQKNQPSRVPTSLADGYHKTAVKALNEAGLPDGVDGVQALLLVGQYSYHHPTMWAVWKTVGAALRLSVEQGLHKDPAFDKLDALTVDTMRRTFWVAYAMDRNISFALKLPSCLSDGAISTKVRHLLFNFISRIELG